MFCQVQYVTAYSPIKPYVHRDGNKKAACVFCLLATEGKWSHNCSDSSDIKDTRGAEECILLNHADFWNGLQPTSRGRTVVAGDKRATFFFREMQFPLAQRTIWNTHVGPCKEGGDLNNVRGDMITSRGHLLWGLYAHVPDNTLIMSIVYFK